MKNIELSIQTADPVHVQIERFLRRQILAGELEPAEQLPSTDELVRQLHVNRASVIKAMARLQAEGLIERKPKRGTFVKSSVDKTVIGVLIGESLSDETSYFQRAVCKHLRSELMSMQDRYWTYRVYDGLFGMENQGDFRSLPMFQNLTNDLRNYPFKGMIQIMGGLSSAQASQLEFNLPTVRLGPPLQGAQAEVILDYHRFGREAVEYAVRHGAKKLVCLRGIYEASDYSLDLDGIGEAAKETGLPPVEIHQLQPSLIGGPHLEQAGYNQTRQLVDAWRTNGWPDAMLISDDIAARGAVRALVEQEKEVAGRLLLVVMANEGIEHHYELPVARYEFSPETVAREMLRVLWKRIAGEPLDGAPVRIAGRLKVPGGPLAA
ncbi:MAG: GntR family transcriptional regulator [Verrucomicrobiae bacterium]|nr:GntR family transcriptional regulator [Verrucomicrobiae bacterium]